MPESLSEFIDAAFSLPTAIFSVLLILISLYWLLSFFTGLNFDMLEGLEGAAEGAVEGIAEGAAEALGEGLGESLGAGLGEVADGADGAHGGSSHHGLMGMLGIGEVPVSITFSLLIFFAWLFTYAGMELLPQMKQLALKGAVLALVVTAAAITLAVTATAVAIKPVRKLMVPAPARRRRELVGRLCRVTTQRVDENFGQAELHDDGASLLLQVRARLPNELRRNSQALIFDYDKDREVFLVTAARDQLRDDGESETT